MREMTPEQQEIKRQYARDLYHKKKASEMPDYKALQQENELLRSILENYRIDLRKLFDNTMEPSSKKRPATATLSNYKKYATADYFRMTGSIHNALTAFATNERTNAIKIVQDVEECGCKLFHADSNFSDGDNEWTVKVRIPRYFDAISAITVPGCIRTVQILHSIPTEGESIVEYGDINGQTCTFQVPIPCPMLVEMHILVKFGNELCLNRIDHKQFALMQIEGIVMNIKVRNDILALNQSNPAKKVPKSLKDFDNWPKGTPADDYFCSVLGIKPKLI